MKLKTWEMAVSPLKNIMLAILLRASLKMIPTDEMTSVITVN